ncbi:MAG TPA: metalloregulator ArsR/SmtB family transcription factor [Baekduia sp.]|nr:metalloregulator ArsR/SmtB family transcription factor [Baekduia sp.]
MPRPAEHRDAARPLDAAEAAGLAEAMRAFGTASRLRLLWALLEGEQTVAHLAAAVDMDQSAVSHQLRLLRQQRLVAVRRDGRHAHYRLFDHHLPELLAALRHHHEHAQAPALSDGGTRTRPTRARAAARAGSARGPRRT